MKFFIILVLHFTEAAFMESIIIVLMEFIYLRRTCDNELFICLFIRKHFEITVHNYKIFIGSYLVCLYATGERR